MKKFTINVMGRNTSKNTDELNTMGILISFVNSKLWFIIADNTRFFHIKIKKEENQVDECEKGF
jgi:hypothetical protein